MKKNTTVRMRGGPPQAGTAPGIIRSGSATKATKAAIAKPQTKMTSGDPLVGKCFVTFGDDGKVDYQGTIRARVEPDLYLIQYFDWIMGEPNTLRLVPAADLTSPLSSRRTKGVVELFEDDDHLRFWMKDGPGRHLTHKADDGTVDGGG